MGIQGSNGTRGTLERLNLRSNNASPGPLLALMQANTADSTCKYVLLQGSLVLPAPFPAAPHAPELVAGESDEVEAVLGVLVIQRPESWVVHILQGQWPWQEGVVEAAVVSPGWVYRWVYRVGTLLLRSIMGPGCLPDQCNQTGCVACRAGTPAMHTKMPGWCGMGVGDACRVRYPSSSTRQAAKAPWVCQLHVNR
jgi:hypothetical protein